MKVEEKLKELLRIPKEEVLVSLVKNRIKGRTYYKVVTYARGVGKKYYGVKKAVESEVLRLWQEYLEEKQAVEFLTRRQREEKERLERRLKEVLKVPQEEETLSCLVKEIVKGRTYYRVITYSKKSKKAKRYRVKKAVEEEVKRLWQEVKRVEEEVRKFLERLQRSLEFLASKKVE